MAINDYQMDQRVQAWNMVKGKHSVAVGYDSEDLTANVTLTENSPRHLAVTDTDGTDTIVLPDEGLMRDQFFLIANMDAVNTLPVKASDGTTTIGVAIPVTERRYYVSDGATWIQVL
jgi:hypothetical protein